MCGIAGIYSLNGELGPSAHGSVDAMTAALAHRGPDGEGFHINDRVAFGHRRLAIIDRAGGHQPMCNEDGSCWITFNGEIYNHRSLRPLLEEKGHRFKTSSDTETILHAYEEFGTACVERLEGMFAFAIYDGRRQALFAARDRLGKKPFFYTVLGGALHFASELPALACAHGWTGDIDLSALEGYLALGYLLAPATLFNDVYKLQPGHWLLASNRQITTRQYWDVTEFDTDHRDTDVLIEDVDVTLRQAVLDRLESEVPLGAFLSGGIDSGLVVSYMAQALGERLVTASVGFGERAHNELEAAGITAAHFGSRHHAEVIEPKLDEVIGPVISGMGEPLADSSAIPTWYVSRTAKQHVTVALSGDGGDESFAGYDFRYVPHAIEDAIRRWRPASMTPVIGQLGALWPRGRNLPKALRIGTILDNLALDSAGAYYADLSFLKPPDVRTLMGRSRDRDPSSSPVYAAITDTYRRCPSPDAVQRACYADLKIYLPNDPLVKVDRMSMAHSLEIRCPLLDRRVVELAFRIPARQKQRGGIGKTVLRQLARRRLPGKLWELPKRGFTAPISEWIAGGSGRMFQDEVLASRSHLQGVLDTIDLKRRFEEHRRGTRDHGYALWAVWVLERWLKVAHASPSTYTSNRSTAPHIQPAVASNA